MAEYTLPTTSNTSSPAVKEETFEKDRFVTPAVDIYENGEGLVVVGDLPGFEREDITVSVDKSILTIKAVRRDATAAIDYLHQEFAPVNYYRQFQLGKAINQTSIDAEYKHGVLRLQLPFADEAKPRQIAVRVS